MFPASINSRYVRWSRLRRLQLNSFHDKAWIRSAMPKTESIAPIAANVAASRTPAGGAERSEHAEACDRDQPCQRRAIVFEFLPAASDGAPEADQHERHDDPRQRPRPCAASQSLFANAVFHSAKTARQSPPSKRRGQSPRRSRKAITPAAGMPTVAASNFNRSYQVEHFSSPMNAESTAIKSVMCRIRSRAIVSCAAAFRARTSRSRCRRGR